VGLCLILPDINPLLKKLDGQLGEAALANELLKSTEIKGFHGMTFG